MALLPVNVSCENGISTSFVVQFQLNLLQLQFNAKLCSLLLWFTTALFGASKNVCSKFFYLMKQMLKGNGYFTAVIVIFA